MSDADRFVDEARYSEEIDWQPAAEPAAQHTDDVTGEESDPAEHRSADLDADEQINR